MTVPVLIADESFVARRALRAVVENIPGYTLVAQAANGMEVLKLLEETPIDLAIISSTLYDKKATDLADEIACLVKTKSLQLRLGWLNVARDNLEGFTIPRPQNCKTRQEMEAYYSKHIPQALSSSTPIKLSLNKPTVAHNAEASRKVQEAKVDSMQGRLSDRRRDRAEASTIQAKAVEVLEEDGKVWPLAKGAPPKRIELMVVGVSTGGPDALAEFVPSLPKEVPIPILIVQHMPAGFTKQLADRLARKSGKKVVEATHGMKIEANTIYIAPGNYHMVLNDVMTLHLNQDEPENSCRPAVDPMFRSAAEFFPNAVLAVMLTGMGYDGLQGSEVLTAAGAYLLAQDEESSVVWGMPGAVAKAGLAHEILSLKSLGERVSTLLMGRTT